MGAAAYRREIQAAAKQKLRRRLLGQAAGGVFVLNIT
jgi:hypothetical protein